jgi:hypothetical protein
MFNVAEFSFMLFGRTIKYTRMPNGQYFVENTENGFYRIVSNTDAQLIYETMAVGPQQLGTPTEGCDY